MRVVDWPLIVRDPLKDIKRLLGINKLIIDFNWVEFADLLIDSLIDLVRFFNQFLVQNHIIIEHCVFTVTVLLFRAIRFFVFRIIIF